MKKTLSLVLSLVMVLSLCAALVVPASAASENIAKGKTYTTSQLFRQSNVTWSWDENSPVAYPDEEDKSLTDGVVGASDAAYTDVVWAGFNGNGTPDYAENGYSSITVDLGSVQNIGKAVLYVGTSNLTSGIGAKNMTVEFFVSDDNQNWTSIGSAAPEDITTSSVEAVAVTANASGRYVQVRMVRSGWMFISEVEVYGAASAPVVEDKVINLLAQKGTVAVGNCEADDLTYSLEDGKFTATCNGTMWPNVTLNFDEALLVDVEGAYIEFEATIEGGNGASIRIKGPVDESALGPTDDIYLHQFGHEITLDGSGDIPSGNTISYKLPLSEMAFCDYSAEAGYAGKVDFGADKVSFNAVFICVSGNGATATINKLNLIVPGTPSEPSVEKETITVDGDLADNGWASDKWVDVSGENGSWQYPTLKEVSEGAEIPTFSYKYQFRADDTKLYGALVLDGVHEEVDGEAKSIKVRIWFRDNDEATVYTSFYDFVLAPDGTLTTAAKYNTSTTENKGANIENTTLNAVAKVVDGKTVYEFSVDVAEVTADGSFDYYVCLERKQGVNTGTLYYPAIPELNETSPHGNHPWLLWYAENDATVNVADIALGEIVTTPETPETGDAGIYAIAGLALVAMLGTAIIIKKRA